MIHAGQARTPGPHGRSRPARRDDRRPIPNPAAAATTANNRVRVSRTRRTTSLHEELVGHWLDDVTAVMHLDKLTPIGGWPSGRSERRGFETEGQAVARNGAARPSLRDRHLCDKPSWPEAATKAAWSRTVFPYALPSRFQFTLNHDTLSPAGRGLG
jgi:hypothetical protein